MLSYSRVGIGIGIGYKFSPESPILIPWHLSLMREIAHPIELDVCTVLLWANLSGSSYVDARCSSLTLTLTLLSRYPHRLSQDCILLYPLKRCLPLLRCPQYLASQLCKFGRSSDPETLTTMASDIWNSSFSCISKTSYKSLSLG